MSFLKWRGSKWYLYYRENGRQKAIPVSDNEKIARDYKAKFDYDRTLRGLHMPNTRRTWKELKLKFFDSFSERDKENKKSTYQKYVYSFLLFEKYASPGTLADFRLEHALTFKSKLQNATWKPKNKEARHYSPSSINIVIRNMRTVFNLAVDLEWIAKNPFRKIEEIPPGKRIPKNLTEDELRRLFAEARKSISPQAYPMALTFYYTGIRLETMVILKLSNLDLKEGRLYIKGTPDWKPKDGDDAAIPLHPALLRALKEYLQTREDASPWLFPGNKGRRDKWAVLRLFNAMYGPKRANIPHTGVHALRHSFITDMMRLNQPHIVREAAGHSDLETTLRYTHVRGEELREAVGKLKDLTGGG